MEKVKIVAEIGINHNGSVKTATEMILMAKRAGADFVKFQKRTIETVYTKEFLDSPRESPWGKTQRDQKYGLEFGFSQFKEIDDYCQALEIPWFASCWDLESLEFVRNFNVPMHKVASPMLTNTKFMNAVASTDRLTLISTGMSEMADIDGAADCFSFRGCPFVLMHCVSEYPCPEEATNLQMIEILHQRFPWIDVGYSNHSPGVLSCIGAVFLGASWIECHITMDRSAYGSDQAASLEEPGLRRVVEYCKLAPKLIGDGVKIIRAAEKVNAGKMRYWESK